MSSISTAPEPPRPESGFWIFRIAAGINIVAKKPNEVSKAMIYAAMVETYAILGLLTSILLVINVGNIA